MSAVGRPVGSGVAIAAVHSLLLCLQERRVLSLVSCVAVSRNESNRCGLDSGFRIHMVGTTAN